MFRSSPASTFTAWPDRTTGSRLELLAVKGRSSYEWESSSVADRRDFGGTIDS